MADPRQLDQNTSDSRIPTPPTTIRITPTVLMSSPDTVVSTAHVRMAPAATRSKLTPMPIVALLPLLTWAFVPCRQDSKSAVCSNVGSSRAAAPDGLWSGGGRGSIVERTGFALTAAVIATAVAVLIPWLPVQASREAGRIDFAYWFMTGISIFVFSLVVSPLAYALWKFRVEPGDLSDGPPIHGHTMLEILWTA